ncbi:MAG: carbohydrate kinase family protein [Chloroflexota bacterium]
MPDVTLLGDINIDIIAPVSAYPSLGSAGLVTAIEYHSGGGVVNTAFALSSMGVDVGIIGCVGSDVLADRVLSDLQAAKVDTSRIQVNSSVNTGMIYIAVTPDGERTMFSARGANVFTKPTDDLVSYFQDSRWYHFSGYALLAEPQKSAAISGLEAAHQSLCRVSLDPGPEPAMQYGKQIKSLLPKVDIFFPNEEEITLLAGAKDLQEGINELLQEGAKAIVVKRDRRGCIIGHEQAYYEIPAFEIQAVDSTGAGDSFNAGVLLGRMVGLSWPASGVLGNALGALTVASKGSGAGNINARQVGELITQDQFKQQWRDWQSALEEVLAWL